MDATPSGITVQSPSTYTESSHTGSSKSAGTVTTKDDHAKENVVSPIDMECRIQAERITKILDETLYVTKLAICVPYLVEEYEILKSGLSPQHMADLLNIFGRYDRSDNVASLMNSTALEDLKTRNMSIQERLCPDLCRMLYILTSYQSLKPKVEDIIIQIKTEHGALNEASELSEEKMPGVLHYLDTLERFRDLLVVQLNNTAAEELSAKFNTHRLQRSNDKLIGRIKELRVALKNESEHFQDNMRLKEDIINKLQNELLLLNQDATAILKKRVAQSERLMVLQTRAHKVQTEMLREEEAEIKDIFDHLQHVHLIDEKSMRQRRFVRTVLFKVETQLLSWVQKYDLEIGEKQVELDEFNEKYEDELRKCEDLEKKLAEQDVEYIPLMEEREKEYQEEMALKMNKFLMDHAARVIQVAWRDVLANRAEKRRLKKLQKKMQAAK